MIFPVRRCGLDRQQKKIPLSEKKKKNVSQRRGDAKKIPLCNFANLRLCVNLLISKNQSEIPSRSLSSNQDNSSFSNSPSMA